MTTVRKLYFKQASDVPNSPLPVMLARAALPPNATGKARRFREAFTRNGWTGLWTDTVYDYTHFHSNAHEVLGIAEVTQAERKAAQGAAPVYMYRWDWPADGEGAHWGAVHGTDLSPAFANPTTAMTGNSQGGKRLALQLGSAFATFARTGNPNNSRIPTWSPYSESQRPVMVFNAETRLLNDPDRELRQMWDKISAT